MYSTSAGADPELVGGGGGWSCMLLLHPTLTCAAADPDLCALCLRWLSPAAIYSGGVSPSAVGTNTPLAPAVVSPIATYAGDVFSSPSGSDTKFALGQLALCGGGYTYK